jgi:hypothetical protein
LEKAAEASSLEVRGGEEEGGGSGKAPSISYQKTEKLAQTEADMGGIAPGYRAGHKGGSWGRNREIYEPALYQEKA